MREKDCLFSSTTRRPFVRLGALAPLSLPFQRSCWFAIFVGWQLSTTCTLVQYPWNQIFGSSRTEPTRVARSASPVQQLVDTRRDLNHSAGRGRHGSSRRYCLPIPIGSSDLGSWSEAQPGLKRPVCQTPEKDSS